MRIKRSHLEALHFVTGTLFTCALVVSVSLNLQAHPLVKMLDQPAKITVASADSTTPQKKKSACDVRSDLHDQAMTELDISASSDFGVNSTSGRKHKPTIEPEIASILAPADLSINESIDEAMNDDCAQEKALDEYKAEKIKAGDKSDDETVNALLNEIESALNPVPVEKSCEDLTPLFDIPAVSWAQSLASN